MEPLRLVAIDWSGARDARTQRRTIWIADWQDGRVALEDGRTREQVCEWLLEQAALTPRMVVGLDFAFSFPAWFLRQNDCGNAADLWRLVGDGHGEEWLRECHAPFWGRASKPSPGDHRQPEWRGFRKTDLLPRDRRPGDRLNYTGGIHPKSPFQIGGAGAVGTGSIRGMPVLQKLRNSSFHIWPFDPTGFPVALEIYPRLFTGPVKKSVAAARAAYIEGPTYAALPAVVVQHARDSEDAFDALVSVLGMAGSAKQFALLKPATDPATLLEGAIWRP
jgi:hypothetical protein